MFPVLSPLERDLTEMARAGELDPVIGRNKETSQVLQIFLRRTRRNPVLIGERGVGKTAIIQGLALRVASGDVPDSLTTMRIVALDLAALIHRTKSCGGLEALFQGYPGKGKSFAGESRPVCRRDSYGGGQRFRMGDGGLGHLQNRAQFEASAVRWNDNRKKHYFF